jgi:Zn-dependent metalloprotease
MNEGFSDMGCVGIFCGSTKSTWLIEKTSKEELENGLRSMSNPKLEGQPDTYGGTN